MSTWGRVKSLNRADFSRPLKIKNVLILALVFVAATKRNISADVVLGGRKGTKLLYVHFGVRYLCTIYVSIFIFLVKMWIFLKM